MPFLSLAVVPIVARFWLSLDRTLVVAGALVACSVAWFAAGSPQAFSGALAASVAGGVVALVFGGYTLLGFEFAIAQALELTEGTVKVHVSSILSKLHVPDRVAAAQRGVALGMLEEP